MFTTPGNDRVPAPAIRAQKRISRACVRCRQKKSKCDLDGHGVAGAPPCRRCVQDGSNCVLGSSHRGGRRVRKADSRPNITLPAPTQPIQAPPTHPNQYDQSFPGLTPAPRGLDQEQRVNEVLTTPNSNMAAVIEDTFASTNLHGTSDALNFLSQAAENAVAAQLSEDAAARSMAQTSLHPQVVPDILYQSYMDEGQGQQIPQDTESSEKSITSYPLIATGALDEDQMTELLARFAKFYHPHLPIAPRRSLQPEFLADTVRYEPHLLTAMLTVAAKDLPGGVAVLAACSEFMQQLVSELSAGKKCDVEAVEALLILAEWEPQSALSNKKEIGCGEEDLAAWIHVGLALRIGYYLRLDRTSFKNDDEERMLHYHRRRLAWAACYMSDRQISVRIGRAFWSRGPGPVSATGRHPSLQPHETGDEDHASIFQATLELTQLYGNVHDVLYSGIGSSMKMMIMGNYVKYIDDFRAAINSWKSVWGTLTCSPNLKITLQMAYEYLRLYNCAYALQATAFRSMSSHQGASKGLGNSSLGHLGALPDARFVYESVDAAKCLLTLVNNFSQQETSLRHFPMRFSLYLVNSAVFLYKAWALGILGSQEKVGVRRMITDSISRLRAGSVRGGDFGSRYAQLLELLWLQTHVGTQEPGSDRYVNAGPAIMVPPTSTSQHEEFSWLDLQAVGEFVTGEQDVADMNLGVDNWQDYMLASRRGSFDWNDVGWSDNDMMRLF